jgi:hypothetical protein
MHAPPANGMQARVAAAAAALKREAATDADAAATPAAVMLMTTRSAREAAATPPALAPPPALPAAACGDASASGDDADDDAAALLTVAGGARVSHPYGDVALTQASYLSRTSHASAVAAHVRFVLQPLAAESARLFGGDAAHLAAAALPAAQRRHLHPGLLAEVQLGVEATQRLEAALSGMRRAAFSGALRAVASSSASAAAASTSSAPPAPPCPAWRALMGSELPWETAVRQLVLRFGAGAAFSRGRANAGALSHAERAWLEEMYAGQLAGMELCTQVKVVMNELLLVPIDEFLECVGTLIELLRRYSADCVGRFTARGAWIAQLMPGEGEEAAGGAQEEEAPLVLYRFFGRHESEALPVCVVADDAPAAAEAAAAEGARACAM